MKINVKCLLSTLPLKQLLVLLLLFGFLPHLALATSDDENDSKMTDQNSISRKRREIESKNESISKRQKLFNQRRISEDDEARLKLETSYMTDLKFKILGKKELTKSDHLFNQLTDKKISDLHIRKFERQLQDKRYFEERKIPGLLTDLNKNVFSFLDHVDCARASNVSTAYHEIATDPTIHLARLHSLLGPFVTIPEGYLPVQEGEEEAKLITSFDLNSYPVTRDLWMEVMRKIPDHVPQRERATWANCKKCPVNYVAYENGNLTPAEIQDFIKALNKKTALTKCTYDLPDNHQLWYSIRGDVTGENQDPYSLNVTDENVNQYITHSGNSGRQIQSVGRKDAFGEFVIKKNEFGIELGNVWKMSKTIFDPAHPEWGRSIRGGSWYNFVDFAESVGRYFAGTGYRNDHMGFSLLRTCH